MRYYFDLVTGDHSHSVDLGGAEYANDEAARQEAILRAIDNRETQQLQGLPRIPLHSRARRRRTHGL